ncbi:hypothetical protein SDRG_09986 [Saprolegnia diclina VS20]|uniref:Uncharacterized protein n=1 Tax=Saprolegnia diclina (strain VS20) TaxID=1156394 RepID=T0QBZ8_SAPDV|nr:hypothetical protein SDRG_09986 [Saprolegnia diclina VS20]EQC32236.1 hypothetical protein SDRG_09986 [Saprolegnia diclina VS20]|eukprot:XP_008614177.1 hypothetical protein SDRG_09986 [Saprolegnia diclina VS20]
MDRLANDSTVGGGHRTMTDQADKPKKRNASIGFDHEVKYGLKVTVREANEAQEAMCLFCLHFGRQQAEGRTRKPLSTVKMYQPPFRLDNLAQHNLAHHRDRWAEYCVLTYEQKRSYFPTTQPSMMVPPPKRKPVASPTLREPKRAGLTVAESPLPPTSDDVHIAMADERLAMERSKHVMEVEMLRKSVELKKIEVISATMLARQSLADAGIARDEIDLVLPLPRLNATV